MPDNRETSQQTYKKRFSSGGPNSARSSKNGLVIPQSPNRIEMYERKEIKVETKAVNAKYRNRKPYKTKLMNFADQVIPECKNEMLGANKLVLKKDISPVIKRANPSRYPLAKPTDEEAVQRAAFQKKLSKANNVVKV